MSKVVKIEKILVDKAKILKIAEKLGCGRVAVYNALAYRSNSELANSIRSIALNQYGGVKTKVPIVINV